MAAWDPALSADGKSLAYVVSGVDMRRDHLAYRLHLRNLDTGQDEVDGGSRIRKPLWSRDGELLAYFEGNSSRLAGGDSRSGEHPD